MTEHTVKAYDEELQRLKTTIAQMGGIAEEQLASAMDALSRRDTALADRVIAADVRIDELEDAIEDRAVVVIAKRQPMANDLREILEKKECPIPHACFVLDICNPQYAQKVLKEDIGMAVALPCRIAIYQESGVTKIATIKPTAVLAGLNQSPVLQAIAEEVEQTMITIMEAAK